MSDQLIIAPEKANYLEDFMQELPVNCLFDKGKTGCGGTTLAIKNTKDTIIAMPYVSLIKNKVNQHKDILLGIYRETTDEEIIEYVRTHKILRFAATYDSIERLLAVLQDIGVTDIYDRFFFLLDEWHILFSSYIFRNRAVKSVLAKSRLFKEVTYMTATPIQQEFILEELSDLPTKKVVWKNVLEICPKPIVTNSPERMVVALIEQALAGKMFGNLHFFVNSVEFISKCIAKANLQPEQVKVVCSTNKNPGKGKKTNQSKLGEAYPIQEALDPPKLINFYTATCFEGCDIYDENGRTYIVSDKNKSHTLIDISTLFIQICGRIRNSNYNGQVFHIFSETRYSGNVTLEEFTEVTNKTMRDTESFVNEVNSMSDENRPKVIKLFNRDREGAKDIKYVSSDGDILKLDKNLLKLDIVNFKITRCLYASRITLQEEYTKNNLVPSEVYEFKFTDKLKANRKAKVSFKDLFIEYAKIRESQQFNFNMGNADDRRSLIEESKPLIPEAYEALGAERVKELNYNTSNIERELVKVSDASKATKIRQLIEQSLPLLKPMPVKKIKQALKKIYDLLGIKTAPKATDLTKWYEAEKSTLKIEGKSVDHYTIVRPLTI